MKLVVTHIWNLISRILRLLHCYNALPKCSRGIYFAETVHMRNLRNKFHAKFKAFTVTLQFTMRINRLNLS